MASDVAIRVEGLSKAYTIQHQRSDHVTLAQVALERLRHPLRRNEREQFWALRDIELEVRRGEVLGVIGRNGAGKSTLLKILSRITSPTTGEVQLYGRVGSLLEVGTGFHPELTGRENVYLNGSILGMSKAEVERQFDAIVEFAGVERFLDTPVKRYSSGMYVRLAFAVAAHLETEIVLLDEVLAVGDSAFQAKCVDKIRTLAASGRTALFVSHYMSSVEVLCDRALLLRQGRIEVLGPTAEVTRAYGESLAPAGAARQRPDDPGAKGRILRASTDPVVPDDRPAVVVTFALSLDTSVPERSAWLSLNVLDERGQIILVCDSRADGWYAPWGPSEPTFTIGQGFLPGRYTVDAYLCASELLDAFEGACTFDVVAASALSESLASVARPHTSVAARLTVDSPPASALQPQRDVLAPRQEAS